MQNTFSTSLNKPTGCGSILHFIKIDSEISRKMTAVFNFSYNVTLNEGQCHPNWYQNVEFGGLYHQTKCKRNQSVNVWIQANVKVFFLWWNHVSSVFSLAYWLDKIKWECGSSDQQVSAAYNILFYQMRTLWEKTCAELFPFSHPFSLTLNQGHGQLGHYQNAKLDSSYHHTKFESNQFINVQMYANGRMF